MTGVTAVTAGPTGTARLGPRLRRWGPLAITGIAILLVAVASGAGPRDGTPLDPTSSRPSGTKALVDTLTELGTEVSVRAEPPGPLDGSDGRDRTTTVLVLVDHLDEARRDGLKEWVRLGGTLVVADVSSPLNPFRPSGSAGIGLIDPEPELRRACPVDALSGVDTVQVPGATLLEVPAGATGCFRAGADAWMVIFSEGRGTVVVLGGAGAFLNARLDEADNAVLAAALLAPTERDRVVVLGTRVAGEGDKGLLDLIAPRVRLALVQLGLAFLVVVLWRARRLGRPVVEAQPVELAGSDLVVAVGALMQRSRGRPQAASILRDAVRAEVAERLGLPRDVAVDRLAEAVSLRTGLEVAAVATLLAGEAPVDEDALVALAQSIDALRAEMAIRS